MLKNFLRNLTTLEKIFKTFSEEYRRVRVILEKNF